MSNCRDFFQLVHPAVALLIAAGMLLLTLFALEDEHTDTAHMLRAVGQLKALAYFLFRSRVGLRLVLLAAHAAHAYEAWLAVRICSELGVRGGLKACWAMQTLLFGIGSLGMLREKQNFMLSLKKGE